jgi:hypothetical protein
MKISRAIRRNLVLNQEVEAGVYAARVREDFKSGVRGRVNATPRLFINGERYDGPRNLELMLSALTSQSFWSKWETTTPDRFFRRVDA